MKFDVAVIGAGPAGLSAAISSARNGAKTVLCTDRPVLGGNSSSEVRVWTRGATGGGNLFSEEMGTIGRLKLRNLSENPDGNVLYWDEILLDSVLSEQNLTLFLNLPVTQVNLSAEKHILSVCGTQMLSGEKIEIESDIFIDATGDGEIAYIAGCQFMMGTEGRDAFGESMAPVKGSADKLCSSILWQTKRLDHPVRYTPPSYAYSMQEVEKMIRKGGRIVTADMQGSDCWWFEYGGLLDTISDSQEIAIELRRIVFGIWNYIKNSGKYNADNLTLEWIGTIPGKRESRRFLSEHILTQNDVIENLFLQDSVAYGGWFLDAHPANGIFSDDDNCVQIPVNSYGIPFSCFYNRSIPNLLFTGRAAGTSHVAFTSYRIMNTCALAGDACGIAASECVKKGILPAELDTRFHEELLNKAAMEDLTFARKLHDKLESAHAEADSEHPHACEMTVGRLPLKDGIYVCVPVSGKKIKIGIEASEAQEIKYRVSTFDLPSRLLITDDAFSGEFHVERGINHIRLHLPEGKAFSVIHFEKNSSAFLCLGGSLCGVCAGRTGEPEIFHPYVQWEGSYNANNVLEGFTRPYKGANAWVADGRKGRLDITLDQPVWISALRIYMDPDLSTELTSSRCQVWEPSHHYFARTGMPTNLVKDFVLYIDGKKAAEVSDNIERMSVIRLNMTAEKSIRLEIRDTYGGKAVVYRILAE